MKCAEALRDLFPFLDGEVSVERNLEILAHINGCPSCGRRFDAERRVEEGVVAALADEPPPADLRVSLAATLDRAEADARPGLAGAWTRMRRRLRPVPVAAAAAAVLLAGTAAAWVTCAGPFQCAVVRAAVDVASRVGDGEAPLIIQREDRGEVSRTLADRGIDTPVPDLSDVGCRLVGAGEVSCRSLPVAGSAVEYRSPRARFSVVAVRVGEHRPRAWNRVVRDGVEWYEARWAGHRVLGWLEPGGVFRAVVTRSRCADLGDVAAAARFAGP